jgi:hypothetical protein
MPLDLVRVFAVSRVGQVDDPRFARLTIAFSFNTCV